MNVSTRIAFALALLFPQINRAADEAAPPETFDAFAARLRRQALQAIEPKVVTPIEKNATTIPGRYPWKKEISTVLFYVGENGGKASAWDKDWAYNFGGFDNPDPSQRRNFMPVAFVPNQNPFYFALPYNDLTGSHHRPEARSAIPWFSHDFERDGKSVCRDRWLAIRKGNRICYAQWSDVGPGREDHWQYVFGNERPKPKGESGAGLSVSPAVRDYLGLQDSDVTDWKFVEDRDVPVGPWARIGTNNTALARLQGSPSTPLPSDAKTKGAPASGEMPKVMWR